jgi:hypothetical protein
VSNTSDCIVAKIRIALEPEERLLLVGEEKSGFDSKYFQYGFAVMTIAFIITFPLGLYVCFVRPDGLVLNAMFVMLGAVPILCSGLGIAGLAEASSKKPCYYAVTDRRLLQISQDGFKDIATRRQIEKIAAERTIVSLKVEGISRPIRIQPFPDAPRLIGTWN